jgi:alginate O-acetyltransferase complex protein AlgI
MTSVITELADNTATARTRRPGSPPFFLARFLAMSLLISAIILLQPLIPAWLFMWLLAGVIFLGCKWIMWHRAVQSTHSPPPVLNRSIFFLAWPGMDPEPFLDASPQQPEPVRSSAARNSVTTAILKICFGLMLFLAGWSGFPAAPIPRGWIAMIGMVLVLHFGIFDLLASFWRSRGFPVSPLMQKPLLSSCVSEFWSKRWNTAFNHIASHLAFRPISRRLGVPVAILVVFFLSGLVHELVISVPARGGYGLPTVYFVLQGIAVLLERTRFGRANAFSGRNQNDGRSESEREQQKPARTRRLLRFNRVFTILVVGLPACLLFHPPFIHNVILPMLRSLGGK